MCIWRMREQTARQIRSTVDNAVTSRISCEDRSV